jgi:ActD protein
MSRWVLAEFEGGRELLGVARRLREEGYRRMDLHTPYPVEGAEKVLALPASRLSGFGLLCGLGGATLAYVIQWFCAAVDYPLNVGARPLHSLPAFVPITFESAVLGAATGLFVGMLALAGFPRLHHPVFESDAFRRTAGDDGFWVSVVPDEARVEPLVARLRELGARRVDVVAAEPKEPPA